MHSITESDGVPSDPYEVLCHMAALIIEGRTPLHVSKGLGDGNASGETVQKPPKPYHEGPHCPNFMKLFSKEPTNIHKCSENNVLCIRFNKLKQHLLHMFEKTVPISIEVSLGPDCLCGELRSQSTLVSVTPCKRDIVLEQWTISITSKRGHEPSQMSVMNLYQAVRSLLHFSQLTAWYMRNNGTKPGNIIYRVGVPGDSAFVSDENFVKHDFPVADINKGVSMKISVKSPPRMENIPSVCCPQHSCGLMDGAEGLHQEPKDFTRLNKEKKCLGLGIASKLNIDEKDELTDLPLKFQGVRKKINKFQDRKKGRLMSEVPDLCYCLEYLDTIAAEKKGAKSKDYPSLLQGYAGSRSGTQKESPPVDLEKSKFSVYSLKPEMNLFPNVAETSGYKGSIFNKFVKWEKNQGKSGTSGKDLDILDDRMQITCGISGKHHCKCEYDEEVDSPRTEKPRRRRSVGKTRPGECSSSPETDKILHGKFKDVDQWSKASDKPLPGKNIKRSIRSESSKWPNSDLPMKKKSMSERPGGKAVPHTECLPAKEIDSEPEESESEEEEEEEEDRRKDKKDGGEDNLESDGGCIGGDEEDSISFEESECADNPFMAAILRTAKKCKRSDDGESVDGTHVVCDTSKKNNLCNREVERNDGRINCDYTVDNMIDNDVYLREETAGKEGNDRNTKVAPEEPEKESEVPMETCLGMHQTTPATSRRYRLNLDLKMGKRLSAVRDLSDFDEGDFRLENPRPSEFISKSLNRLKSLFDKTEISNQKSGSDGSETEDNSNSMRTIPVPSAQEKLKFRRSLDSAAQLVFHRCSGLPLTSSPAPVRRNNSSFSFDSSLNSVSAIKSALFDSANSISSEDENESEGSLRSPASPGAWSVGSKSINYHSLSPLPLLGTFEESVLNGRLEPVSTVQGFTAELGASGSFCPRHLYLPVTVFFYTLGDNDKVSAPYLGHINLGKKGYSVPRSGTIQVTLFNPLRTVVKMFVVVYDLHDMPPNSHTFLRQRTLYVPASQKESVYFDKKDIPFENEDYHKYLRYLIHLRFISGKTGRIYLHTDIRMIIFRKADEDTANALGRQVDGETFELRSHTHGPTNPKFSPRK